jgi:hypothetical protein
MAGGMDRIAVRALEDCREVARSYFRELVGLMLTPGGEWATATDDPAAARAFLAEWEPFLYPLIFGGDLDAVRPHLARVARVLKREGELSDTQILRAAARYFSTLLNGLQRAKVEALPA